MVRFHACSHRRGPFGAGTPVPVFGAPPEWNIGTVPLEFATLMSSKIDAVAIAAYAMKSACLSDRNARSNSSRRYRYVSATVRMRPRRLSSRTIAAEIYEPSLGLPNLFARSMYSKQTRAATTHIIAAMTVGVVTTILPSRVPNTPRTLVAPATIPSDVVAFDSRFADSSTLCSKLTFTSASKSVAVSIAPGRRTSTAAVARRTPKYDRSRSASLGWLESMRPQ